MANIEFSEEELSKRLEKIRDQISERGLNALIVASSSPAQSFTNHGNVRYLTGFVHRYGPTLMVLPLQGDLTLYASLRHIAHIAKTLSIVKDVRLSSPSNWGKEVRKRLDELGIRDGIGLVGMSSIQHSLYESVKEAFPGTDLVNADDVFEAARMIKSPGEIELMRKSAHLADLMFESLTRSAKDGEWIYKVRAAMLYAADSEGAEYSDVFIASEPNVVYGQTLMGYTPQETWRRFRSGDQVLSSVYTVFQGYWCQELRTGTIGEPSSQQRDVFNMALEAHDAALNVIKPGAQAAAIGQAAFNVLKKSGLEVAIRLGHGLGLDYVENPLTRAFPQPIVGGEPDLTVKLQEGMTLEVHVFTLDPELKRPSVALGDVCLVTDAGVEQLTKFSRDLF
ncbi:MAG: M24 family metallopeptidase [Nitrososphaeria archaeon]|nr:M24 family metallopeptidase [Nitrososphaeria archaeon]NIN51870.1 M24 family metallopeptidase [Nitrososphaeria archaeon]NIQ32418.1 M24 family metallopeptidase [Nitrososphaeria archaeon]